ncbi:MAG: PAS domain-containing protein, partial [Planctomycetes bacterium]|nr:PAS domain-containing protein [Planctomycetota bacterium]
MLRDPLFRRAFLTLAVFSAAVVSGTAALGAWKISEGHEAFVRGGLERRARETAEALDGPPGPAGNAGMRAKADLLARATGLRLTVFTPEGEMLADTGDYAPGVDRPEVAAAALSGAGYHRRLDARTGLDTRYAACQARTGAGPRIVRVAQAAAEADAPLRETRALLGWSALFVWAAATLFAAFVLLPVWTSAAALRLALNEPKAVFPRGQAGVLGDLARRTERLLEENRDLRRDRSTEREEAGAILASMSEPVMAVDAGVRLRVLNQAAARLLGLDPAAALGQPIGVIVRSEAIAEAAARAAGGAEAMSRAELPGPPLRVIEVHAQPIRPQGGAVVVLRDVTETARFAEMRRDFVAAASHELRTPLAVIAGTVETLLDGGLERPEQAREFLTSMERQLLTLTALVNDLLDLGKLESRPEFTPRACDVAQVLAKVVEANAGAAGVKGLSLAVDAPAGLPRLMADAGLLERAFSNLVENAVRYTPHGGSIEVRADGERDGVRVTVKDTGIGIPEKDLKRFFERFYRVDKSRSREAGGTGLGLAIVKHIVALHKGEVWA